MWWLLVYMSMDVATRHRDHDLKQKTQPIVRPAIYGELTCNTPAGVEIHYGWVPSPINYKKIVINTGKNVYKYINLPCKFVEKQSPLKKK